MLTLIINAEVYDPEPRGRQQLLLGGGQVLAMDEHIDISGTAVPGRIWKNGLTRYRSL